MPITFLQDPRKRQTNVSAVSEGLAESGLGEAIDQKRESNIQSKLLEAEDIALERSGIPVRGVRNPKLRELLLKGHLEGTGKEKDFQKQQQFSQTFSQHFGEEAAKLYDGLTEGGKSNYLAYLLRAQTESKDTDEAIRDFFKDNPQEVEHLIKTSQEEETPQERPLGSYEAVEEEEQPPAWALEPVKERKQTQSRWDKMTDAEREEFTLKHPKEASEFEKARQFKEKQATKKEEIALKKKELAQKDVEKSFEAHKDFIDNTTNQYRAFETETKPRLLQMQSLDPEKIVSPTAASFLESMGIPLGALEHPESELYKKLSQDLMKGLPETYGNRILKVEVDNFLSTIPQLVNSPDGRRMIASNMLKLGEMKEIFYNEMRRQQQAALSENQPLPRDFEQSVFDNVRPQIDKLNREFVAISRIKYVPPGHVPAFGPDGANGPIYFIEDKEAHLIESSGGKRIW